MFRKERERLQKLVLVPYRPFRNLSLGIGGVILIIAAAVLSFYSGSYYSQSRFGIAPDEIIRLRERADTNAAELKTMREAAAIALHDRNMEQAVTEQLRQENKSLIENIANLQDQIVTYQKLLSPSSAAQSISANKLDLRAAADGHVNYRLLLIQMNAVGETTGEISVKLVGAGKSIPVSVGDNRYAFRHFQNLSGSWQLPEGFQPERVDVQLKPAKGAMVKKSFRWELAR